MLSAGRAYSKVMPQKISSCDSKYLNLMSDAQDSFSADREAKLAYKLFTASLPATGGGRGLLSDHSKTCHKQQHEKCFVCGQYLLGKTKTSKLQHMDAHLGIVNTGNKCKFCVKLFKEYNSWRIHLRSHTGEAPYRCGVCPKRFTTGVSLKVHERLHTGERPYKCDVCSRNFNGKSVYNEHKRTHTGETPYKCSYCEKPFSALHNLRDHKRTHTGERPYKCSYCEKAFSTLQTLGKHERIHTGERPYHCNVCSKSFIRISDRNVHQNIHLRKPYMCSVCLRCFEDTGKLNKHHQQNHAMGRDLPVKHYLCHVCEKFHFDSKASLDYHLKTAHTGK